MLTKKTNKLRQSQRPHLNSVQCGGFAKTPARLNTSDKTRRGEMAQCVTSVDRILTRSSIVFAENSKVGVDTLYFFGFEK